MKSFSSHNFLAIFFLFIFFITFGCQIGHAQSLVINEILASSHSSTPDPDFSQISDWIEIYNTGNTLISLSGYSLTDDFSDPQKWHFPADAVLAAGGYLVVWADGNDMTGDEIHTNFKLSNNGEVVGLYAPNGSIIDTLSFGAQPRDVSYGRSTGNLTTWLYFEHPTPGHANSSSGFSTSTQSGQVNIGAASGFYSGTLSVTMTAASGTIRYTTDGSTPTRTSAAYNAALTISRTTVLKARAFEADVLPGPITTRTFFMNETTTLPVFSLTADPDFLWDDEIGIYVDENIAARKEWERPGVIEFFNTNGHLEFSQETAIRLFGRTAIYIPQKSLSFFFSNTLHYPLFEDHDVKEFDSFLLRSSSDDWHLTMFRDGFIQEMVQANMQVDTQDYRPAVLFINGEYWGIHNIREKYNESYLATHHHVDAHNLDMLYIDERAQDLTVLAGDRQYYDAMIDFANTADLSQQANYDILAGMVDIDNLIDYVIAESYIGNRSWSWNIRAWRPRTDDGKWQWLIFDLDRGFRYLDENPLHDMADRFHPFDKLLNNSNFRNQFIRRFIEYINGSLSPENIIPLLDSLQANIAAEIPHHSERWADQCGNNVCGISSVQSWQNAVEDMRSIVRQRPDIVRNQLINEFKLGSAVDLNIRIQQPGYGIVKLDQHTTISDAFSGHYFKNMTVHLKAESNDAFQFLGWRQGASSAATLLQRGSNWKYFDQGTSPGASWTSSTFNDANWPSGYAELGYGDGDETTIVDYGPDSGNKYVTTYFRSTFTVSDASKIDNLIFRLKRDDGAVIYLNGHEMARSNMPTGEILYSTRPTSSVGDTEESTFYEYSTNGDALISGINHVAVEVHQYSGSSSDLSFDLEIVGTSSSGAGDLISENPILDLELVDNQSLIAVFTSKFQYELPPQITQNRTLTAINSPYLAFYDVVVNSGVTLTLEKGAEILFAPNASLIVNGQLTATGTKEIPVTLKGLGGDRWGALCFDNATGASTLSHVHINGATTGSDAARYKAAVSIWSSDVTLNYARIDNVSQPLYANDGTIILTNSVLDGTASGDDIANIQYASARVEGCHLFGNGELDFDSVHKGVIRNNRIDIISTNSNRDGIDIGASNDVLIENNRIFNCPDKGISVGEASTGTIIRRNLVVNASMGVAVKDNSYATIDHNTFVDADTGVACYEKIAGQNGGHAIVTNSIFAGRFTAESSVDAISSVQISYSLSEHSPISGVGNILGLAQFVDASHFNFYLRRTSPAIDVGDPAFTKDIDGTRSDIGAYIFNQGPLNTNGLVINEFMADNSKTIVDEHGEFDDWIELYNGSDQPIDAAGLYLTDDASHPTLWRIADYASDSTTIAPGGYLLLWADEDSTQGMLHAGFKLNASKEQIALVKADKNLSTITVLDSVNYGAQQTDFSTGRTSDGASSWRTFASPTPGSANGLTAVSSSDQNSLPTRFVVHPNYPNPFNPTTSIAYELPKDAYVTIDIYNALGQRVYHLLAENVQAGVHQIQWRGVNDAGQHVSSGVYVYRVIAGEYSATGKMMLMQ